MPAPNRNAVPTGRVMFTMPIRGSNVNSVVQVTVMSRGTGPIPEEHWALASLVWQGVRQWADSLATYPDEVVHHVSVSRSVEYTVDEAQPDPSDSYLAKDAVWPPPAPQEPPQE
jgi:hypothetical protein